MELSRGCTFRLAQGRKGQGDDTDCIATSYCCKTSLPYPPHDSWSSIAAVQPSDGIDNANWWTSLAPVCTLFSISTGAPPYQAGRGEKGKRCKSVAGPLL